MPTADHLDPAERERAIVLEDRIAWARILVVIATAGVFGATLAVARHSDVLAAIVLVAASIYAVLTRFLRPYVRMPVRRIAAYTVLIDTVLITMWCLLTGGADSEYWVLFVAEAVAVGLRYQLRETVLIVVAQGILYLGGIAALVRPSASSFLVVLLRHPVVVAAGATVAALSRSERLAELQRSIAEETVRETSRELDQERRISARLRELDRAKSDFVATAAHELRSPLAGIRGVLETVWQVGDDLSPGTRAELLEGASAQAARLSRLVDDLLTVSRIEDGSMGLRHVEADVDRLVVEAAEALGVTDRLNLHVVGSPVLSCDAEQMLRVLVNLLDNARKYSPEGSSIEVSLDRSGQGLRIAVRDHGAGVRPEDRDTIFDRYRRVGGERVMGSGLGLWIVRNLVEAHGGSIAVDDAPDGGARFTVEVPDHADPEGPPPSGTGAVGAADAPEPTVVEPPAVPEPDGVASADPAEGVRDVTARSPGSR